MNVLILANSSSGLYRFRSELLVQLLACGHEVFVSVPKDDCVDEIKRIGVNVLESSISRHGLNPFADLKLLYGYCKLIRKIKPDIVFTYTIKPNVYGGVACQICKIPYVANITGLGTAVENAGLLQKLTVFLYKIALRNARKVFLQNSENLQFLLSRKVLRRNYSLIPGSGVNLKKFHPLPYPTDSDGIHFVFISRIMREKGIEQYLDSAIFIKQKYPKTFFHVCGSCEKEYQGKLEELVTNGTVIYHGRVQDVREIHAISHCTIHPSFYPEGISNVLLESCACARPVITTNRSGCRETVDDGVNGFVVKQCDSVDLIAKIEKFLAMPHDQKMQMGLAGRIKVEREFDRQIVIDAYMKELENS